MQTVSKLATQFGTSKNTIRVWTAEFSEYLSPTAQPPKGQPRRYTDDDLRVLALVAYMRSDAVPYDDIRSALASGQRAEPFDQGETDDETGSDSAQNQRESDEQPQMAIDLFRDMLGSYTDRINTLEAKLDTERDARLSAEKRAAAAEAALAVLEAQAQATAAGQGRRWWEFWKRDE